MGPNLGRREVGQIGGGKMNLCFFVWVRFIRVLSPNILIDRPRAVFFVGARGGGRNAAVCAALRVPQS